jgi:hypothetical protein
MIPMRVPQRNFVVEFKSRSRQPKVSKPASIWGDTDLNAAARQVEDQSAHLFEPPAFDPPALSEVELEAPTDVVSEHPIETEKMIADVNEVSSATAASVVPASMNSPEQTSRTVEAGKGRNRT